jgi:hypothetical protein
MKAIQRPSEDQAKSSTPRLVRVNCRASPPPSGMTQSWGLPERVEMKASSSPFGDHLGVISRLSLVVNLTGSRLPSAGTSQMLDA